MPGQEEYAIKDAPVEVGKVETVKEAAVITAEAVGNVRAF